MQTHFGRRRRRLSFRASASAVSGSDLLVVIQNSCARNPPRQHHNYVGRQALAHRADRRLHRLHHIRGRHQADPVPVHADGHCQRVRVAAESARRSGARRKRSAGSQRRPAPQRAVCAAAQPDANGAGECIVATRRPDDAGAQPVQSGECADAEREYTLPKYI